MSSDPNATCYCCRTKATREARAKVIVAEGEQRTTLSLKSAADIVDQGPVELQFRYLQTLTTFSAAKNLKIIFRISIA